MTRLQQLLATATITLTVMLSSACEESAEVQRCGALEDPHGCPISRGGSCADRACGALYACQEGAWARVEICDNQLPDAGDQPDAGDDAALCEAGAEAPSPPCPPLLLPECDATLLDGCLSDIACMSGCEVFLRCQGGDWAASYAAYCDDEGNLVRTQ